MGKAGFIVLVIFSAAFFVPGQSLVKHKAPRVKQHAVLEIAIKKSNPVVLKKLVDSLHIDKNKIILEIHKSAYILNVMYDSAILKTFPVVFGFNPVDDKLKQGDGCTPEGIFGIRAKYPHGSWSKFIWIDYPNKSSWEKHKAAKKNGTITSKSSIGGEVGIHGVPEGYDFLIDQRENWTLGCISLKNKDVDELYEVLGTKTMIHIFKD